MGKGFESAGEGHRLSSSSNSNNDNNTSNSTNMNVSELRARRLAALANKTTKTIASNQKTTETTNVAASPTGSGGGSNRTSHSTKKTSGSDNHNNSNTSNLHHDTVASPLKKLPVSAESITIERKTISSQFLADFNSIMWDDDEDDINATTTKADKTRWFDQGIHTKILRDDDHEEESKQATLSSTQQEHDSWGLLQSHGGPCGVLAALQAELITKLGIHHQKKSNTSVNVKRQYSRKEIEKGLADCIATILVRASMAPNVVAKAFGSGGNEVDHNDHYCVKLMLPSPNSITVFDPSMLECISIRYNNCGDTDVKDDNGKTNTPEAKRPKQIGPSDDKQHSKDVNDEIGKKLRKATSDYILSKGEDDSIRLKNFHHNGGVMLLTMSLAASRGVSRIKGDMDVGTTHHLTAQFGHSSQELINLLLTGQATTNIFDNTMTLGGSLQCHGIQSQPSIGYLSQLEALRYCSVGHFYKSPKNPVWLIGSTSHFSVLFGTEESLKESKSDLLLDQCRRAFKSVEGAEENGFIPVTELEYVLKQLDLDLKEGYGTLAASLEMSGAGIILWNDFWKKVSRLKTGASLGNVVQDDEEFARQLQAQFESELNGTQSAPQAAMATAISQRNGLNFETYSDHAFQLYHYNGMRGGELTSVTVTRMSSEEAVGADATLVDSSAGMLGNSGASDDLESVIRTKYPSCMFDWGGRQPPSLH